MAPAMQQKTERKYAHTMCGMAATTRQTRERERERESIQGLLSNERGRAAFQLTKWDGLPDKTLPV